MKKILGEYPVPEEFGWVAIKTPFTKADIQPDELYPPAPTTTASAFPVVFVYVTK